MIFQHAPKNTGSMAEMSALSGGVAAGAIAILKQSLDWKARGFRTSFRTQPSESISFHFRI